MYKINWLVKTVVCNIVKLHVYTNGPDVEPELVRFYIYGKINRNTMRAVIKEIERTEPHADDRLHRTIMAGTYDIVRVDTYTTVYHFPAEVFTQSMQPYITDRRRSTQFDLNQ